MLRVSIHAGLLRDISRFNRVDWLDIGYEKLDAAANYKIVLFNVGGGRDAGHSVAELPAMVGKSLGSDNACDRARALSRLKQSKRTSRAAGASRKTLRVRPRSERSYPAFAKHRFTDPQRRLYAKSGSAASRRAFTRRRSTRT
jgi:hypothetical protein